MHHMNFIIVIKGFMYRGGGVKYRFSKSHNFRKLAGFCVSVAELNVIKKIESHQCQ